MLNRFAFDPLPADLLHVTPLADWIGFCVLKASVVECQLIPLIDTPSTSWFKLDRHSIDISVECWSRVNQFSIDLCVGQHLADYQPTTVDRMLTEYRLRRQSSIAWDVVWGHQSRISINIWLRMTLVHRLNLLPHPLLLFGATGSAMPLLDYMCTFTLVSGCKQAWKWPYKGMEGYSKTGVVDLSVVTFRWSRVVYIK